MHDESFKQVYVPETDHYQFFIYHLVFDAVYISDAASDYP